MKPMTQPIQSELTDVVIATVKELGGLQNLDFPLTIDYGGYSRDFSEEEVTKFFSIGLYRQVWWSKYSSIQKKEQDRRDKIILSIVTPEQLEEVNRRLNQ